MDTVALCPDMDTDLLTADQAATIAGASSRTVRRWADTGKLPIAHRLPGPNGAYLFRRSDVLALVETVAC